MSKNILEVLFESKTRLKILKFLYRNFPQSYVSRDIVSHTHEYPSAVRKELKKLAEINLVASKKQLHSLNPEFEYFTELRDLILKSPVSEKRDLVERIHKLGKIKLAIISGIFLDKELNDPIAIDLFLVHDYLDKRKLTQFLKNVESEVGTEIRFATMDKEEFKYRMAMFDRFVRVLFEGPHEKLINKLGI